MELLITQIQDHLNKKANEERKKEDGSVKLKDSFWCSETETPIFDLYHKWIGTPPTNPSSAEGMMIMNTGKMVELSLVDTLNDLDLIVFKKDEPQFRVDMVRMGARITGYMDCIIKENEVKDGDEKFGEIYITEEGIILPPWGK